MTAAEGTKLHEAMDAIIEQSGALGHDVDPTGFEPIGFSSWLATCATCGARAEIGWEGDYGISGEAVSDSCPVVPDAQH